VGHHDGLPGDWRRRVVEPRRRGAGHRLRAHRDGHFAAIPAVYFYNHFTSQVRGFASQMEDFSLEFLNISERNFT
jgi:biopolymer transport protein TolQ